jgi:hypothetical protein
MGVKRDVIIYYKSRGRKEVKERAIQVMCVVAQMASVICEECVEENHLEIIYLSDMEVQYTLEVHYVLIIGVRNFSCYTINYETKARDEYHI